MEQKGLYNKYTVINNVTGNEVSDDLFVLKPKNDPAARAAILVYATVTSHYKLSIDLINWVTRILTDRGDGSSESNPSI